MPSNHYFQFKEFKIEQKKSGMKVCTDSCVFGAWVADKIERKKIAPKTILDIGAGTGLLSLMVAQKSNAQIDSIEIDKNSYEQTLENFLESPWAENLQAYHGDIKKWNSISKYDLIISNPPFFENDLKANYHNKNLAKHDDGLSLTDLLLSVKNNLAPNGNFGLLLPFHRLEYFKKLAIEFDFYLEEELLVKQTPKHSYFRGILFYGRKPKAVISDELIIKDGQGNYTDEFQFLLKDYYLKLS